MDVSLSLMSVVCWQVEVSALGQSLVQRSPTECDCEAPIKRPWCTSGCCAVKKKGGGTDTEVLCDDT
jgi:hypothetical protein